MGKRKNIVLVGFMGAGKTKVAREVAFKLGMEYISVDDMIEKVEDRSINDIFRDDGEPYFRKVEKDVLREVMSGSGKVVDTGGGVVLDPGNMEIMKSSGTVVCLWAAPREVYERTKDRGHRPLLNVDDPEKRIEELLEKRRPYYMKADEHIDTTELTVGEVSVEVIRIIDGTEKS